LFLRRGDPLVRGLMDSGGNRMTSRRTPFASSLFLLAGLSTPVIALADGAAIPHANAILAPPTLGPFGIAGIVAGAAGVVLLISRHRRKGGED